LKPELHVTDPVSYKQAINGADAADWLTAIRVELQSHVALRTWKLTLLPSMCDPGAYYQLHNSQVVCILLVYVDDILIASLRRLPSNSS